MSEMGDMYREMRKGRQRLRQEALDKADTTGFVQLTPWHFQRMHDGDVINWWPSGDKWQWRGRIYYGRWMAAFLEGARSAPRRRPKRKP